MYICAFAIGRPIGTPSLRFSSPFPFSLLILPSLSRSPTSYTQHPTTASVGPYSLINRTPLPCPCHELKSLQLSASPPTTSTPPPCFSPRFFSPLNPLSIWLSTRR